MSSIEPGYDILPDTSGGLFTSSRSSAAGLNKARWAKIIDSAGSSPVRYAWEEQTMQALDPGQSVSIGFVTAPGGLTGTVDLHPVIEPNDGVLEAGDYVLVRAEYFDPLYDWVFVVQASGGGGAGLKTALVKCLSTTPADGRYDGKAQNQNADGTLRNDGASVWLRDGNNTPALINGEVYPCVLTGATLGRLVYTTVDFNLTIRDQGLSQSQDRTLYAELGPENNWIITRPAARRTLFKRILDVYEGIVLRMDYVKKLVFKSSADPMEDDFDLTAGAAGSGDINEVALAGATETLYLLECCQGGQLKARQFSIRRGSIKVIGSRVNDPGCASS